MSPTLDAHDRRQVAPAHRLGHDMTAANPGAYLLSWSQLGLCRRGSGGPPVRQGISEPVGGWPLGRTGVLTGMTSSLSSGPAPNLVPADADVRLPQVERRRQLVRRAGGSAGRASGLRARRRPKPRATSRLLPDNRTRVRTAPPCTRDAPSPTASALPSSCGQLGGQRFRAGDRRRPQLSQSRTVSVVQRPVDLPRRASTTGTSGPVRRRCL